MDKLKPCPFCGETPVDFGSKGEYRICCIETPCAINPSTTGYYSKQQAISAWNERKGRDEKPSRLLAV